MSRTTRFKLLYVGLLVVLGALALIILSSLNWSYGAVAVVVVILLIPGRVQGHFYRDLFKGRRLVEAGRYNDSIQHSERFLREVRRRPGLKRLIWFAGVIYTDDPEAMALSNIGVAHLEAGRFDAAETTLREALRVDPEYPLPLYNLAVLFEASGKHEEAVGFFQNAAALGYQRDGFDQVVHRAGSILARIEGGVR
ncbi:MAG: tetratricopeptide repeat protein [Bacteroidota bacterium]